MNNLEKVKLVGSVFAYGCKEQLKQDWTIGAAAFVGLGQGLKYKGNFKRGATSALAVVAVLMVANGLNNVIGLWPNIANAFDKE